jgi:hypothetical protein
VLSKEGEFNRKMCQKSKVDLRVIEALLENFFEGCTVKQISIEKRIKPSSIYKHIERSRNFFGKTSKRGRETVYYHPEHEDILNKLIKILKELNSEFISYWHLMHPSINPVTNPLIVRIITSRTLANKLYEKLVEPYWGLKDPSKSSKENEEKRLMKILLEDKEYALEVLERMIEKNSSKINEIIESNKFRLRIGGIDFPKFPNYISSFSLHS